MKKAHFIGIAGVGMSATAILLKESGWDITGSDEGMYPPISTYLSDVGIECNRQYSPENIPADVDVFVIGKNAKLDPNTNIEVQAAMKTGKPIQSFPEVLHAISQDTQNIVVAGSYGKSTVTALLAWCLTHAHKDPSYFIGALPIGMARTSHRGRSSVFVMEGDEYPSSHTDARSKFLHLNARDVLLTSLVHDHVNVFPTEESYLAPFYTLTHHMPHDGLLVAMNTDTNIQHLLQHHTGPRVTYSREHSGSDWYASDIHYGETTSLTLMHKQEAVTQLTTTLLGTHNVENIVGASALLLERNLLSVDELKRAVATFAGVVRRLDRKDHGSRVPVYEGFGSSYEKAKSAIAAMTLHYPERKLLIVFEPHTFTWRNRASLSYYADIFQGADYVLVYEPATQGKHTHDQLSHHDIIDEIRRGGVSVSGITSSREGLECIQELTTDNHVILLLSSGNLDGLIESIPAHIDKNFAS